MAIVRHLRVQNFRGIQSLDWHVSLLGSLVQKVLDGGMTRSPIPL